MGSAEKLKVGKYSDDSTSTKTVVARNHKGEKIMTHCSSNAKNNVFIDLKTIADLINVPRGYVVGSALKYESERPSKLRSRDVQSSVISSAALSGLPANTNILAFPILLNDLRSHGFFISEEAERECFSLFNLPLSRR